MRPGPVAAVGECMLELSGDGQGGWRLRHAGDTFNTLWTLKALAPERPADYVSAFGDDPFSVEQKAFFGKAGIGTATSPIIPGARPGLYAITLTGAERSFTYWRADSAARRLADDRAALAASLSGRALIHFSGITLAILEEQPRRTLLAAIGGARAAGATVSFDPNYRPRLWPSVDAARAAFRQAAAVADLVLPTFPDEQELFGDGSPRETAARYAQAGAREVVVKNGTAEALILFGSEAAEVPAVPVENPVDTTGAGDAFNGGYLAARLTGDAPAAAAAKAHRVAAAAIQVRGALADPALLQAAFAQTAMP